MTRTCTMAFITVAPGGILAPGSLRVQRKNPSELPERLAKNMPGYLFVYVFVYLIQREAKRERERERGRESIQTRPTLVNKM